MMRRVGYSVCIFLACLAAAACEKDAGGGKRGNGVPGTGMAPDIVAFITSDDRSKVTYTNDFGEPSTISLAWEKGDSIIGCWQGADGISSGLFTYRIERESEISADGHRAHFSFVSGTGGMPQNGDRVYMFYAPGRSMEDIDLSGDIPRIAYDLSSQDGTCSLSSGDPAEGDLSWMKEYAYICAEEAVISDDKLYLDFRNRFSIVGFRKIVGLAPEHSYTFTLSATGLTSTGFVSEEGISEDTSTPSVITVQRLADENGAVENLYMIVPSQSDVSEMEIAVKDDSEECPQYYQRFRTISFSPGRIYVAREDVPVYPPLLSGIFSVSPERKVRFSRGNLFYDGKNWDFEKKQKYYRSIGGKQKYDGDGYDDDGTASGNFGIFLFSTDDPVLYDNNGGAYRYGTVDGMTFFANGKLYSERGGHNFADWGTAIGSYYGSGWFTMSYKEWEYLLCRKDNNGRSKTACVKFKVDGSYYISGLLLFDDSQDVPAGIVEQKWIPDYGSPSYFEITESDYEQYASEGAVFLPLTGAYPYGGEGTSQVAFENTHLTYWTGSLSANVAEKTMYAFAVMRNNVYAFEEDGYKYIYIKSGKRPRDMGAVRLVKDINIAAQ